VRLLARQIGSEYVFPEVASKLEETLLDRLAQGAYDRLQSAGDLAQILTGDLREVAKDKHLGVELRLAPPAAGEHPPVTPSGIRKIEVLDGNVGYMELEAVPALERSRSAIAGAFALLESTEALIIDNRNNDGGDPATVAYYVSQLSSGPPFLVTRIHFRNDHRVDELFTTDLAGRSYGTERPVFVLNSSRTFSGGEDLAYNLQALERAKIIGELSGGGAHPTFRVPLGHDLVASIPFARSVNPLTESNWEGTGVIPDVPIPAERALSRAHELAREQVRRRRAQLDSDGELPEPAGALEARVEDPPPTRAPNQIDNGDFSRGIEPWGVTTWSGPRAIGEHPYRLDGGVLCFSMESGERVLLGWPPETSSYAAALESGVRYGLSFKASLTGSLPVSAHVSVGHRLPPYTAITTAEIALAGSLQSFVVHVQPEYSDDQVGLAFKFAASGSEGQTQICLDDVVVAAL
jgi:retinol-binding protein 3